MKNKPYFRAIVLGILLIGVVFLLTAAFGLIESYVNKAETPVLPSVSGEEEEGGEKIFYSGAWYEPRQDLETVLVLGIDRSADAAIGRTDSEQADFFALLLIDKNEESFRILHLNRDTMTSVPMTDISDREYNSKYCQLALAHTYGTNEYARCRNTVKAVERLLYGIEIDHYISLTMDAVAILNDSIGGVTLQIREDLTELDPSYTQNAVVTLNGTQALNFVRARGSLEDSSNLSRMERQRQYIGALFEAFTASDASRVNTTETLLRLNEHMASDYTADQLSSLYETLKTCTYEGIDTLAGEAVRGNEYMEFYIDETAAQAAVIGLFYQISEKGE